MGVGRRAVVPLVSLDLANLDHRDWRFVSKASIGSKEEGM